MRKEFFVTLCVIGLVFGAVTIANAGALTWTILQGATQAGHGPGADAVLGTADDTTIAQNTETNKCDFVGGTNCATTGSPTTGSYSYLYINPVQTGSCMYVSATDPNNGKACTTIADCPGTPLKCQACAPVHVYMGKTGTTCGQGTFATCQQSGTSFTYTGMTIGMTESVPGLSDGCLELNTGTNGGTTPCGAGAMSSTANLKFYVLGGLAGPFPVPQLALNGYVYKKGVSAPQGICNYTVAGINALLAATPANATYMMVACEPGLQLNDWPTTAVVCLPKATVSSVLVSYTTGDVADCATACTSGGCAGATAEDVQ